MGAAVEHDVSCLRSRTANTLWYFMVAFLERGQVFVIFEIEDVLVSVLVYIFFYNIALVLLFGPLCFSGGAMFSALGNIRVSVNGVICIIALLSMAGVPPLAGFFTKILVLLFLLQLWLGLWVFFFIVLLLVGLWFYFQYIRFFCAAGACGRGGDSDNLSPLHYVGAFILIFAGIFFEDIWLLGSWLLG